MQHTWKKGRLEVGHDLGDGLRLPWRRLGQGGADGAGFNDGGYGALFDVLAIRRDPVDEDVAMFAKFMRGQVRCSGRSLLTGNDIFRLGINHGCR